MCENFNWSCTAWPIFVAIDLVLSVNGVKKFLCELFS